MAKSLAHRGNASRTLRVATYTMLPIDNPFESISPERLAAIYRWPAEATAFLEGEADCLHIVGDAGMGKTALLLQIQSRLDAEGTAAPYTCFPPEKAIDTEAVPMGPVTLLDETDRLTAEQLGGLLARAYEGGHQAALASHRDQRRQIKRARLSCLYLRLAPLRWPNEVAHLLNDRIVLATGTPHHEYPLEFGTARALLRHSRGNIERCLQLGYEIFEDIERPRPITTEDVAAAAESLSRALR
jgi:hypothetical protein